MYERGNIVSINGRVGVVVLTGSDLGEELHDRLAVWFGAVESGAPQVWTIPAEYLSKGPEPVLRH